MIKILKFIPYLYLIIAVLFLYDGIERIREGREPYLSFAFTAVAVFLFFFRKKHQKKIAGYNKQ